MELILEGEPIEGELLEAIDAEPEFLLAEAELSPLRDGEELEDAFVELLEE